MDTIKTIQINKEPNKQVINVYANHGKRIGKLEVSHFGQAFSWNGEQVIDFMLDVLTDCNYHTERKEIEKALSIKTIQQCTIESLT